MKSLFELRSKYLRVIIAGGRKFDNFELLKFECDKILKPLVEEGYEIVIISGKALGADKLGEDYAKLNNFKVKPFPADWDKYKKKAGSIRNEEMAKFASNSSENILIAFWDMKSTGTNNMITLAYKYKLKVFEIYY